MATKYIFVTGGVVSSLGKGLAAASIGAMLEARGLTVTLMKFDPYINVDPGTMSPYQHGEVYVLDDGAETDLDLGHYERFTNAPLTATATTRPARSTRSVIEKERRGRVPRQDRPGHPARHRRDQGAPSAGWPTSVDVVITEIGGTVGDIEGLPFLEAIRQFALDVGRGNCRLHPPDAGPLPQGRRRAEDQADAALRREAARDRHPADDPDLPHRARDAARTCEKKIALFCNVDARGGHRRARRRRPIYEVPLSFAREGLDDARLRAAQHPAALDRDLSRWESLVVARQRTRSTRCAVGVRRQVRQVLATRTSPSTRR